MSTPIHFGEEVYFSRNGKIVEVVWLCEELSGGYSQENRRRKERMMSRCFIWFPIMVLGEPYIYQNLGYFTRMRRCYWKSLRISVYLKVNFNHNCDPNCDPNLDLVGFWGEILRNLLELSGMILIVCVLTRIGISSIISVMPRWWNW